MMMYVIVVGLKELSVDRCKSLTESYTEYVFSISYTNE